MQTIDLGNITIGGDAPQQPPMAPELPCLEEEKLPANECPQPAPEPQPCAQEAPAPESASAILSSKIAGGICFNSCETYKSAEIGCVPPDGQGRILDLSFTLRGVCPNCRIAVCVALYEVDSCGCEKPCGIKMFTVGPLRGYPRKRPALYPSGEYHRRGRFLLPPPLHQRQDHDELY